MSLDADRTYSRERFAGIADMDRAASGPAYFDVRATHSARTADFSWLFVAVGTISDRIGFVRAVG